MKKKNVDETVKEDKKPKSKTPLLIIIVLVVGLVAATGGTVIGNLLTHKTAVKEVSQNKNSKIANDAVTVPLDEFLTNLAKGEKGQSPYIKIQLSLLAENEDEAKAIEKNKDVIRDSVVNVLRKKQSESILNDAKGIESLKEELKGTINEAVGSELVKEVFITNLVIQ
ncbi:hypothetical protein CBF34_01140 [Vagococcus penaei]|uniref:Flagellar protein FliL n=1 Tax=Vagococcus penaei TaxID=633807 RepID=A0A1Q2D8C7_9ENTE|nr:flagellar basal body-associated FliL family protein [Vagococcus penaei]AQP54571.1 hypothetical protein BW732_10400 [Vagococcus penaei]RSU06718.1 hypothetical protein CBF34_01140 [Vagococcus penaei]